MADLASHVPLPPEPSFRSQHQLTDARTAIRKRHLDRPILQQLSYCCSHAGHTLPHRVFFIHFQLVILTILLYQWIVHRSHHHHFPVLRDMGTCFNFYSNAIFVAELSYQETGQKNILFLLLSGTIIDTVSSSSNFSSVSSSCCGIGNIRVFSAALTFVLRMIISIYTITDPKIEQRLPDPDFFMRSV